MNRENPVQGSDDSEAKKQAPLTASFKSGAVKSPSVSVIVTNYNYERYISDCLRSIAAQTTQPIECIVIDDVSTDGSVARIQEFIQASEQPSRYQFVQVNQNAGQMNAVVEGFRRSSGDFIVFVDADDYLFPDFIETHLAAHLNTEYAASLTSSNEVIMDGSGRVLAGSIENSLRHRRPDTRLAPNTPVDAVTVDNWSNAWRFEDAISLRQGPKPLLYVAANGNGIREFIWSTTSGTMFRRGALDFVLTDRTRDVRISADFYLFHYCHLLGGTTLIQTSHGFYRRHDTNNFSSEAVIGRGARSWKKPDVWSREDLFRRLEDDLVADIDQLTTLLGKPRTLQMLASFVPARRAPHVLRAFRGNPIISSQYLAMLLIRSVKKAIKRISRLWSYV